MSTRKPPTTPPAASSCAAALKQFAPRPPQPQRLSLAPFLHRPDLTLDVLRLDLIDPQLSGNKWYKLRPHLLQALAQGHTRIVSLGGAHSNHLHALAAAGQRFGFTTIGLVRGPLEYQGQLTPTLADASAWGMQLHALSRAEYARRYQADWLAATARSHNAYIIGEGGADACVLSAMQEFAPLLSRYDLVAVACGSGATLAALASAAAAPTEVLGVSVLKDEGSTAARVQALLQATPHCPYRIESRFHNGGFARLNRTLLKFMDRFAACCKIPLEPVYSGKLFHALLDGAGQALLAERPSGQRVLAIHTGGLQGARAMQRKISNLRATAQ